MSNRNRTAGNGWELSCIKLLKSIFPHIVSSRSSNRKMDALKVDIVNEDEIKQGRLPFNFQCKNLAKSCNYYKTLSDMPDFGDNIILHKFTSKKDGGVNFTEKGQYAIMNIDTLLKILKSTIK